MLHESHQPQPYQNHLINQQPHQTTTNQVQVQKSNEKNNLISHNDLLNNQKHQKVQLLSHQQLKNQQVQIKSIVNLTHQNNQKSNNKQLNFISLLAERPINIQNCTSNKKIPICPPQEQNNNPHTSKTSQNFYVSTSKTGQKNQKSKSSQKIFLSKLNQPLTIQQKQNGPLNINNQAQQISDITVLILLNKIIQRMRARGDDMTLECLVNEQKLIHITIAFLQKKIVKREDVENYYSLEKQIIGFVQKINKVTMENFKEEDHTVDIKIFSKAVDLLMTPNLNRFVKDLKTLGKIKVLTFNNLACIYKKKKKFGIALRSVSFALQIQEALLNQQTNQQKYDIIPTYLNKAAILSEMNKHEKAIDQIMKSQKFIQKIQRQVIKQITEAENNDNKQLQKRLEQKRYYGLYMKMIINYNMGAQKEHMKMTQAACQYYKQGRQLALMINNEFMAKKFQNILNKIMEQRKK